MAELVYAHGLGPCPARVRGSSPLGGTNQEKSMPRPACGGARPPNRTDFWAQNGTGGFRWERKIFNYKVEKILTNKYMNMNQKGFANIILVVVIVAVLVGAVGYFAFVKKSEPIAQQPTPTPTQTITPAPTQTPKVETTNWLSFNSVKDTGIKPDFSFKHPSNWIQKGSIDGGAASYIPFYDKDTYSQKCDEAVNGATTCHVTGQVASALVSGPSMSPAKIEYNSETKEAIIIDGYQGTKITGFVKSGVELNAYIGKPGQKEMRVIIPNVNGIRFEFTMLIESKTDEATFSEILKTIVFNF